jgi:hypothetical protein
LLLINVVGCTNPFAPGLDENDENIRPPVSDQKDIAGVFQNFQYAYTFRDTTIYGGLITNDFTFTYRDYDQGFDVTWGRDEDLRTTHGLFENSQRLDLIWNNIVLITEDSLTANIVRSFNLTITFNPTDVVRVDGRVNLTLIKNNDTGIWRINKWIDESNF